MEKLSLKLLQTGNLGENLKGLLVVKTAKIAKTRVGKSYLTATLSDGILQTNVNVWNWPHSAVPQPNDIVEIIGKIGEYNGNRQLEVDIFTKSSTGDLADFMPQGNFNIDDYRRRFNQFKDYITDKDLRTVVEKMWTLHKDKWDTVPGALSVHNDYYAGMLQHTVDVCNNAVSIYANYAHLCNLDLVIAGALLHDVGKLYTYAFNETVIEMTHDGQLLDHIPLGALMLENARQYIEGDPRKLTLLMHIVLSHHGKLEYGSPVTPKIPEAILVNYADGIDAKMRLYERYNDTATDPTMTDRVYFLDNKPMYKSDYISSIFSSK